MKLHPGQKNELPTRRIFFYTPVNPDLAINQMIVDGFGGVYFFIRRG
jgi:hypothetical protein